LADYFADFLYFSYFQTKLRQKFDAGE